MTLAGGGSTACRSAFRKVFAFARESASPLLEETGALRLGDNVGAVTYLSPSGPGATAVTGYARTVAQRMRATAGG